MVILDVNHKSGAHPTLDRIDALYRRAGRDTEWMQDSFGVYGRESRLVVFSLGEDPLDKAKVQVLLYDEEQDLDGQPVDVDPELDRKLILAWLAGRSKALQRRAKVAQG